MREEWKMQEEQTGQMAFAVRKSRLRRSLCYWGREVLGWVASCIAVSVFMGMLQLLGINTYVQGDGVTYLALFPMYLLIMGTLVLLIFGITMFQATFPVLVSVNVTRRGAVCGIVLSQGAASALILLLAGGIWMILPESAGDDAVRGLLPFFTGILFVGVTFGILFGVVMVRWGKLGVIIMMIAFGVLGGFAGAGFAMFGKDSLIHMQEFLIKNVAEKNFWPVAAAGVCVYAAAGVFAVFATAKTEVKV